MGTPVRGRSSPSKTSSRISGSCTTATAANACWKEIDQPNRWAAVNWAIPIRTTQPHLFSREAGWSMIRTWTLMPFLISRLKPNRKWTMQIWSNLRAPSRARRFRSANLALRLVSRKQAALIHPILPISWIRIHGATPARPTSWTCRERSWSWSRIWWPGTYEIIRTRRRTVARARAAREAIIQTLKVKVSSSKAQATTKMYLSLRMEIPTRTPVVSTSRTNRLPAKMMTPSTTRTRRLRKNETKCADIAAAWNGPCGGTPADRHLSMHY